MRISSPLVALILFFLLSRLYFWGVGVAFNDSELGWFFQFLGVDLLENDLLRSLWHLHAQPPLLNLLAGIGLKLGQPLGWWFWKLLYLFMGLVQTFCLYDTLKRLGARPWISAGIVSVYMIGPAIVLFENWLFYPYPAATLLILAAWLLTVHSRRRDPGTLFLFFVVCSLLPLLRSLFHLLWLIGVVLVLLAIRTAPPKKILLAAALPLLLVAGWYAKNLILFDSFSGSSWMGMNFARATVFRLPDETREDWIEEGVLSEISSIGPFSPLSRYEPVIGEAAPTGIPCLDRPLRGGARGCRRPDSQRLGQHG